MSLSNGLVIFILYLITILMLLVVLTIHEMGHFMFAKIYKVNVKEFSIGFGPKLWHKTTKKGMRVSLRLIPLAAYVVLDSKSLRSYYRGDKKYSWLSLPKPRHTHYLENVNLWQYTQIMFGGVLLNLCAFLLVYIPVVCVVPSMAAIPFVSIGDGFATIGKNMVGMGSGDIFGQLPSLPDLIDTSIQWLWVFGSTFMMMNLLTFVFNLLPLPPLDGWKIVKQSVEKTTGKKMNLNVEFYFTIFVCIIFLWAFVSGIVMDFIH